MLRWPKVITHKILEDHITYSLLWPRVTFKRTFGPRKKWTLHLPVVTTCGLPNKKPHLITITGIPIMMTPVLYSEKVSILASESGGSPFCNKNWVPKPRHRWVGLFYSVYTVPNLVTRITTAYFTYSLRNKKHHTVE